MSKYIKLLKVTNCPVCGSELDWVLCWSEELAYLCACKCGHEFFWDELSPSVITDVNTNEEYKNEK